MAFVVVMVYCVCDGDVYPLYVLVGKEKRDRVPIHDLLT